MGNVVLSELLTGLRQETHRTTLDKNVRTSRKQGQGRGNALRSIHKALFWGKRTAPTFVLRRENYKPEQRLITETRSPRRKWTSGGLVISTISDHEGLTAVVTKTQQRPHCLHRLCYTVLCVHCFTVHWRTNPRNVIYFRGGSVFPWQLFTTYMSALIIHVHQPLLNKSPGTITSKRNSSYKEWAVSSILNHQTFH